MITKRHGLHGKNYGVVVLPGGLIEFIPEFSALIQDINEVLAKGLGMNNFRRGGDGGSRGPIVGSAE